MVKQYLSIEQTKIDKKLTNNNWHTVIFIIISSYISYKLQYNRLPIIEKNLLLFNDSQLLYFMVKLSKKFKMTNFNVSIRNLYFF